MIRDRHQLRPRSRRARAPRAERASPVAGSSRRAATVDAHRATCRASTARRSSRRRWSFDEIFFMSEVLLAPASSTRRRPSIACAREIADALASSSTTPAGSTIRAGTSPPPPRARAAALTTDASSFGRTYRHLTFASEYRAACGRARRRALARPRRATAPRTRGCCSIPVRRVPGSVCSARVPHRLAAHWLLPVQPALAARDARRESRAARAAAARTARERLAERRRALLRARSSTSCTLKAQAVWDLRRLLALAARARRHAGRALRPLARRRHRRARLPGSSPTSRA